jgi:CheY-like chemotaxis protein
MAKILIVEDDSMNREMLCRRMAWEGFQVVSAVNGADAVRVAQSELPDLILMDLGLPVMNGQEATRVLKSAETTWAIPIIVLTAFASTEDRERSFAAGCDDFETKPVNFPQLFTKIRALLDTSALR